MLQFVAGLVVGLVAAALIWRNNKVKFANAVETEVAKAKVLADAAIAEAAKLKVAAVAVVEEVKKAKKTK